MRKSLVMLLVAAIAVCALPGSFAMALAEPAAAIIKVEGDVVLQRAGKQKSVRSKCQLMLGDKVVVNDGSAIVLFTNGKKVTVKSELEITEDAATIEGKDNGASSTAANLIKGSVSNSGKDSDLLAGGGVAGAVRAAGGSMPEVQILSLLNTSTIQTRPVFVWEPGMSAVSNTVVLMDEMGEEVWSLDTEKHVEAYPEDMDPLERGMEYVLEVTSIIEGMPVSAASTFYILDEDETAEVEETVAAIREEYATDDDLIIQHMLLAQYYMNMEMYMDALEEYKKLVAADPYDMGSYLQIAKIHKLTGNKDAAEEAVAQAQAIQEELGDDYIY